MPSTRRLRILWAEDNAVVADLIRNALESRGHECSLAVNGADALAMAKTSGVQFDVIGTDFSMPGMDGLNLVRSLREAGFTCPILVFASGLPYQTTAEFRRCGVNDIFAKPAGFGAVLMKLKALASGE